MSTDWQAMEAALIGAIRTGDGQITSGPFTGRQVLLLTTTGAQSGESRTTPLVYSREGDDLVIIASMDGAPTHPAWYHNLVKEPKVTIETGGTTFSARATVVPNTERRRLYDQHADLHASFKEYESRTDRVIPVIRLKRLP